MLDGVEAGWVCLALERYLTDDLEWHVADCQWVVVEVDHSVVGLLEAVGHWVVAHGHCHGVHVGVHSHHPGVHHAVPEADVLWLCEGDGAVAEGTLDPGVLDVAEETLDVDVAAIDAELNFVLWQGVGPVDAEGIVHGADGVALGGEASWWGDEGEEVLLLLYRCRQQAAEK